VGRTSAKPPRHPVSRYDLRTWRLGVATTRARTAKLKRGNESDTHLLQLSCSRPDNVMRRRQARHTMLLQVANWPEFMSDKRVALKRRSHCSAAWDSTPRTNVESASGLTGPLTVLPSCLLCPRWMSRGPRGRRERCCEKKGTVKESESVRYNIWACCTLSSWRIVYTAGEHHCVDDIYTTRPVVPDAALWVREIRALPRDKWPENVKNQRHEDWWCTSTPKPRTTRPMVISCEPFHARLYSETAAALHPVCCRVCVCCGSGSCAGK